MSGGTVSFSAVHDYGALGPLGVDTAFPSADSQGPVHALSHSVKQILVVPG
jgi:hypothetical protein